MNEVSKVILTMVMLIGTVAGVLMFVAFRSGQTDTWDVPTYQFVSGTEYNIGEQGQVIVEARFANGTSAFMTTNVSGGGGGGNATNVTIVHTTVNMTGYNTPLLYNIWDSGSVGGRESWRLFNDNKGSCAGGYACWNANYGGGWFTIDLGAAKDIEGVELWDIETGNYPRDWNISYSNDNATWSLYYGILGYGSGLSLQTNFTNGTVSGRYWRFWGTSGQVNLDIALTGVKLYESASVNGSGGNATQTACNMTVWYPDKSVFINATNASMSASGNQYIGFVVPNATGVYEYQADCALEGNRTGIISKSFHVSEFQNDTSTKLNRVRAVMPR